MRILVYLPNTIPVFEPDAEQLATLARSIPTHELEVATSEVEFLTQLPRAEVAVVWRFDAAWYARAPRLRHVCTPAAGREGLAEAPVGGGIALHFGSFHGQIMAESLVAMVLAMNRRFDLAQRNQTAKRWERGVYTTTRLLAGQTALILGFGAIGRHAAQRMRALGMRVHGLKRQVSSPSTDVDRLFILEELHAALALADHVACILPGDASTRHLLNAAAFASMKPSAYVYNLGRGNAIDSLALVAALRSGSIAGAFLDVTPEEPLPESSPLWDAPNLLLTPHASAICVEYLSLYFQELAGLVGRGRLDA